MIEVTAASYASSAFLAFVVSLAFFNIASSHKSFTDLSVRCGIRSIGLFAALVSMICVFPVTFFSVLATIVSLGVDPIGYWVAFVLLAATVWSVAEFDLLRRQGVFSPRALALRLLKTFVPIGLVTLLAYILVV